MNKISIFLISIIVVLSVALLLSYKKQSIHPVKDNSRLQTVSTNNPQNNPDTNEYTSESMGISLKLPKEFKAEEISDVLEVYSPRLMCRVKGSNERFVPTSELWVQFKQHNGVPFNVAWKTAFDFDFIPEDTDGQEIIGGKIAYYFSQGAEMPMTRKAYMVNVGTNKNLEINAWRADYEYECQGGSFKLSANEQYPILDSIVNSITFIQ